MLTERDLAQILQATPIPPDASNSLIAGLRQRSGRRKRMARVAGGASVLATGVLLMPLLIQGSERPSDSVLRSPTTPVLDREFVASPFAPTPTTSIVKVAPLTFRGQDGHIVAWLAGEDAYCQAWADQSGMTTDVMTCTGPARIQNGDDIVSPAEGLLPKTFTTGRKGFDWPDVPPCALGVAGNRLISLTSTRTAGTTVLTANGSTYNMFPVPGAESWPLRLWTVDLPAKSFVINQQVRGADGSVLSPRDDMAPTTCAAIDAAR